MVGVDVIMLVDICCLQMEPFTILYPSFLPPRPLYLHKLFYSKEQFLNKADRGKADYDCDSSYNKQYTSSDLIWSRLEKI